MRIGIHTSISGGFDKAVKRLTNLGCNACQIFSRSPRGGKARALDEAEVKLFKDLCHKYDIYPVVVHIPYLVNPATPDQDMHNYAVSQIREDIERADLLGAAYLVLHMGSHKGAGTEKGLSQVIKTFNSALADYHGDTILLLENTSGAGKEVGSTFEQLKIILDGLENQEAGICFDTCHGFAAGYDLSDGAKVRATIEEMDSVIGLSNLKLIHANDSMFALGSTRDRHADIGQGYIGEDGFRALLHHPRLQDIPFILETPADSDQDWARNLATMRRLAGRV